MTMRRQTPQQVVEANCQTSALAERKKSGRFVTLALLAVIIAATVAVYRPILFNFFVGDDFGHLTWLKEAVVHPELVWKNFYSPWLDGTTTRFYRPLISVFMVTDYLMWGTNGLGFHITNLLFHLASTVLIFFIARNLLGLTCAATNGSIETSDSAEGVSHPFTNTWLYPLSASLIFGLYPLHTEAVSWITGRVDVIVTAFYLASLWCYMSWRKNSTHDRGWLAATLVFMVLGLMSKEMAVTLPVLFIAYEILLHPGKSLIESALRSLKATVVFWLVIVAYFGLRRYALGTLVGGYDDSLFFVPDVKEFIYSWVHGLRMFIEPLNRNMMGGHHLLTHAWEIHLALLAVTFAAVAWLNRTITRLLLFNLAFLAIAFVPVYKIFTITDDLQGNRLAHLATVALSLLIAMCFVPMRRRFFPVWQSTLAATFSILCFAVLWTNNQAWANAGREANAIREGLAKLYAQVEGDPQVLLVGLPDNIDGAYVMRNAMQGMTRTPQMHRDAFHAIMLNQFEQTMPIGFLKESIRQADDKARIFWWNAQSKEFEEVKLSTSTSTSTSTSQAPTPTPTPPQDVSSTATTTDGKLESWSGTNLKQVINDTNGRWLPDGSFEATRAPGRFGRPEVNLDLGTRSSFDTNFVSIKLKDRGGDSTNFQKQGADLLYSHRITNDFSLPKRTHGAMTPTADTQEVIMPLRSLPEWTFRGEAGKLLLLLPRNSHLAIESISILAPERLFPALTFKNSGYLNRKGEIHLSQKAERAAGGKAAQQADQQRSHQNESAINEASKVYIDATRVPDASSAIVEVTRGNLYFEFHNMPVPSKVIMSEHKLPRQGSMTFTRDMFPSPGIYEARAWALDKSGNKLGVAGDHILIVVDD